MPLGNALKDSLPDQCSRDDHQDHDQCERSQTREIEIPEPDEGGDLKQVSGELTHRFGRDEPLLDKVTPGKERRDQRTDSIGDGCRAVGDR